MLKPMYQVHKLYSQSAYIHHSSNPRTYYYRLLVELSNRNIHLTNYRKKGMPHLQSK